MSKRNMQEDAPVALVAVDIASRTTPSVYPEPFASLMRGRDKKSLGDPFGLEKFGVNLTRLAPGALSALRHAHNVQDELVYVLQGHPVLITAAGETPMHPGMCAGFKGGTGDAHHLVNRSNEDVVYLEVGDRTAGECVSYPDDDLEGVMQGGTWHFRHKDGMPYA